MKPLDQLETDPTSEHGDSPWWRTRRAVTLLALATVVAAPTIVATAEAAHARIALNHNEAAGRDG